VLCEGRDAGLLDRFLELRGWHHLPFLHSEEQLPQSIWREALANESWEALALVELLHAHPEVAQDLSAMAAPLQRLHFHRTKVLLGDLGSIYDKNR